MSAENLDNPAYYINRELSWLAFNERVLRQGLSPDVPLLERLKFLAIVSSNLDEFFMIRVAGLRRKARAEVTTPDISGLSPAAQLAKVSERVRQMVKAQSDGIRSAFEKLAENGIRVAGMEALEPAQKRYLARFFLTEVQPLLTPLAAGELQPFPNLPQRTLNLALLLKPTDENEAEKLAVVPIPAMLPRFVTLPASEGVSLARIEDVAAANMAALFPQWTIAGHAVFRVTRDADVAVDDDEAEDLLRDMAQAIRERGRRDVVRLEIVSDAHRGIVDALSELCEVGEDEIYPIDGMLDATGLMEIAGRSGLDRLRDPDAPPQHPRDLPPDENVWEVLQNRDVLLVHPYESFDPVLEFLEKAADDPAVMAIKQTLYRTSGDSPVIRSLARAAENGKQVTVLVELKARFDESRNIDWARRLEDAGCHVIYGIAGLKTHAKMLLVMRREASGIRRYVHMATGNYNERTARLYSDVGLMTSDRGTGLDASAFFNLLTGYSQEVGWEKLTIAPTGLRQRFMELIEREISASTPDQPGLIMAKVNSLHDAGICKALYRASAAGVKVLLNVRGICCLRPGLPKVSENIRVVSIVDRYLEHARIFYFRNGGHEEVYLSSADWMTRNIDRRLETLFPVTQPEHRSRLTSMLRVYFADNVKAMELRPDGDYTPVQVSGERIRAQEKLYADAAEAAAAAEHAPVKFRPLTRRSE